MAKHSRWATDAEIVTETYRGPDRRRGDQSLPREVQFDGKGNAVLHVRTDVPRRREGDDTIDLIEALDADALCLETESESPGNK